MQVLGLTGSIGMGKSTAAKMLRRLGLPLHDADATVHRLFAVGGAAVAPVAQAFPAAVSDGAVDRRKLGALVFQDPPALRLLESIVHPLVRAEARRFLSRQRRLRREMAVLDVPLLYETGGERLCDRVILITAPRFLQEQRVLRRPGMTRERLEAILAQQLPDEEKRRRADFIVHSGRSRGHTFQQLRRIVRQLREEHSERDCC
ncbi:MAG TPA: dephospho-CoA kinase [Kiloniellales bacterium]|nr:dephospho-CoA kinase [Kiloniellales bacterium]